VHAVQYWQLGLQGFAEHYVRGFLSGGSYEEIPLEKQAYELEGRLVKDPTDCLLCRRRREAAAKAAATLRQRTRATFRPALSPHLPLSTVTQR
jgi:hypothetical protein